MEPSIKTKTDWSQVRRAYEYGEGPAARVAEAFGVSPSVLSRRRRAENWRRKSESLTADAVDPADEAAHGHLEDLTGLLERASAAVSVALAAAAREAGSDARDAGLKSLDLCLRALEKIMGLRERDASFREARETKSDRLSRDEEACDEDLLRAELERRLARLAAAGGAEALSCEPE